MNATMRVDSKLQPHTTIADLNSCRVCGCSRWKYLTTYCTEIDLEDGSTIERCQSSEELRCAGCNTKASRINNAAIRLTALFKRVRKVEDNKV